MYAGKLVEFANVDNIFYNPLHPYTLGLIGSVAKLNEEKKERLKPIKGSPPSLIDLPAGCTFTPRCRFAIKECKIKFPQFIEEEAGHFAACYRAKEFLEGSISRD
jgi:oligopeptide/dipeptide ABC transporter ATP-binding protein